MSRQAGKFWYKCDGSLLRVDSSCLSLLELVLIPKSGSAANGYMQVDSSHKADLWWFELPEVQ
jgi:hypothetical protein